MSTSRNMPKRFKSRTHLKYTVLQGKITSRAVIIFNLNNAHTEISYYYERMQSIPKDSISKHARYAVKVRSNYAKQKLLAIRAYRKSVVLPRLP